MLKNITLNNVGPSAEMHVDFGDRLTVITGDNGLGKSFLLDVAWWALTRKWPGEVNPMLVAGSKALPTRSSPLLRNGAGISNGAEEGNGNGDGSGSGSGAGNSDGTGDGSGRSNRQSHGRIAFTISDGEAEEKFESIFRPREQSWSLRMPYRGIVQGLVLYVMSDGSFAVWDPERNHWLNGAGTEESDIPSAYVFTPTEVWDGLRTKDDKTRLCNGLILDWASWQREGGATFDRLKKVLEVLSPNPMERLEPGQLTRISLNDPRAMPTIKMPYGQEVPIAHASSGIRRILALAYLLTWAWEEHQAAAALMEVDTTNQITLMVDEVEAHLHPQWQRRIVPALLGVVGTFSDQVRVQVIVTTHSPLVMASLEPLFSEEIDCWLDLDYERDGAGQMEAVITERPFVKLGDASNWLTGDAFDLDSARSLEAADALEKAAIAMSNPNFGGQEAAELHASLGKVLGGTDPFWVKWRYVAEQKGWPI